MIIFNQKIVREINHQVRNGESVTIKVKAESVHSQKPDHENNPGTVDSVTSGSFETKMHFARSQQAANTALINREDTKEE